MPPGSGSLQEMTDEAVSVWNYMEGGEGVSRECISNADPQPWQTAALVPVELDGRW